MIVKFKQGRTEIEAHSELGLGYVPVVGQVVEVHRYSGSSTPVQSIEGRVDLVDTEVQVFDGTVTQFVTVRVKP